MSDKHRLPHTIVGHIEDAIGAAEMTRASFDFADPKLTIILRREGRDDVTYENTTVTDFIRERTRLYRGSWIIGPLKEVLAWSRSKDDGSIEEYDVLRRLKANFPHPDSIDDIIKECEQLRDENAELRAFKNRVESSLERLNKDLQPA